MKPPQVWLRCSRWSGVELTPKGADQLLRYREFLVREAIPGGGLGPGELQRVDERHIGDSLLFAGFVEDRDRVLDFGSGVGLPGIPMAVVLPQVEFVLVDRSGRRGDLARRAVRILELENVQVLVGDLSSLPDTCQMIVSRATLPPERSRKLLAPHLGEDGVLVIGGSWVSPPRDEGWELITVPPTILDQEVWLLMMRSQ